MIIPDFTQLYYLNFKTSDHFVPTNDVAYNFSEIKDYQIPRNLLYVTLI